MEDAIRRSGAKTQEVEDRHGVVVDGSLRAIDFEEVWQPVADRLHAHQGADIAFAQFLRDHDAGLNPLTRALVRSYVEGFYAANEDDVSVQWLRLTDQAVGAGSGPARRIVGGFSTITDCLVDELNSQGVQINFNCEAKLVRWKAGHVQVETASAQSFIADQAIVTIPLGVLTLLDRGVRFAPALPEKAQLWQRLKMGAVVKILLHFHESPWQTDLTFLHTPSDIFETWWAPGPSDSAVVTGWVGGPKAAQATQRRPQEVLSAALDVLSSAFSRSHAHLESALKDWRICDWQADPLSRGAYMYVPVGACDVPRQLAEPVAGTLFFAGEATELRLAGTTGGALASGARAARELLQRKA